MFTDAQPNDLDDIFQQYMYNIIIGKIMNEG